jgi:hypothetical protein
MRSVMTTFAFLAPRHVLPVDSRKTLLKFLDQTNKWCLMGNFGGVIICIAFNFTISDLAGRFFGIDGPDLLDGLIFGEVQNGWYINLAGVGLAHIVNQWILSLHRAHEEALPLAEEDAASISAPESPRAKWGKDSLCFQLTTVFTLVLGLVLLLRVAFEDSLIIDITGVLQAVLEPEDVSRSFSLVGTFTSLPGTAEDPTAFGIQVVRLVGILFAFVLPVVHLVLLVVLFVAPLQPLRQWQCFYATELLSAWSMLDLFTITFLVTGNIPVDFATIAEDEDLIERGIDPADILISAACVVNAWFVCLLLVAFLILGMNFAIVYSVEDMVMARARTQHNALSAVGRTSFESKQLEGHPSQVIRVPYDAPRSFSKDSQGVLSYDR